MSLNKVMLIGNVGKDPEVRYLENNPSAQPGTNPKVAQFTMATTERFRDRNGETRENTEWHNIVAWRGLADLAEKYIRKGSQIYVEGQIRTRSWTDQAGAKQYRTEIIANAIQLLGRKSDNPGAQPFLHLSRRDTSRHSRAWHTSSLSSLHIRHSLRQVSSLQHSLPLQNIRQQVILVTIFHSRNLN